MSRDYYISGPCMVQVKGMTGTAIENVEELGTAQEQVQIIPRFIHQDINVDDFGPDIPPEVMAMLMEVSIRMTLVNFDRAILETCMAESVGGGTFGTLPGAGILMGGYVDRFAEGNHYIGVNLTSPSLDQPWRFKHCFLTGQPVEWPVGADHSAVRLTWRCIPYTNPTNTAGDPTELVSAGVALFDRTLDSD